MRSETGGRHPEIREHERIAVSEIIRQYNVFLLHGFNMHTRPHRDPGEFSPWMQKLKDIEDLAPEISCSSYSPQKQRLFAHFGIIINSGYITDAFPFDAGTLKLKDGRRQIPDRKIFGLEELGLEEKIHEALLTHENYKNELTISHPQIAGLFLGRKEYDLAMEGRQSLKMLVGAKLNEILSTCSDKNLPLYFLDNGVAYSSEIDQKLGRIKIKAAVDSRDLLPANNR